MITIAYLLGNLILASVLGYLFTKILKRYQIPTVSKFLVGASLLPFFLGLYMLLVTIIPWRLPNSVYVIIPYIISIGYIVHDSINGNLKLGKIVNYLVSLDNDFTLMVVTGIMASLFSGSIITTSVRSFGFIARIIIAEILVLAFMYFTGKRGKELLFLYFFCGFSLVLFLLYEKVSFSNMAEEEVIIFSVFTTVSTVELSLVSVAFPQKKYLQSIKILSLFGILRCVLSINQFHSILGSLLSSGLVVSLFIAASIVILKRRKQEVRWNSVVSYLIKTIIVFIALCLLFCIIRCIIISGVNAVSGSDANQYLSEAYDYSIQLKFGSMNDFHGNESGSLLSNIHSPVWPGYLANGLLYSSDLGYPSDYGARMAFAMSYIYLLCDIFALGYLLKNKFVGLLSCCLFFCYKNNYYLLINSSREGFRMIPLIVFCILLIGIPKKPNVKLMIPVSLVCMFIMIGHPINAITAIAIFASYTVFYFVILKGDFKTYVKLSSISIVGALIGSYQIIWAYIETGSLTGGLIDFETILRGTSYYNTYISNFSASLGSGMSYFHKISEIVMKDKGVLFIPALASSIILCIILFNKKRKENLKLLFIVFIILTQILLLSDIFAWSGRSYLDWCFRNYRYSVQMYIFYAIIIGVFIDMVLSLGGNALFKGLSTLPIMGYLFFAFNMGFESSKLIGLTDVRDQAYDTVSGVIDNLGSGKILLDNYNMNYQLSNRGICFWTAPMDSLRKQDSDDDFYTKAKELGITSILITESYRDLYWKDTELERFVSSPYISSIIRIPDDYPQYTIYMIKE